MIERPEQLILASASPRRSELLERMGLVFKVRPTHVEEDDLGTHGPEQMVFSNAKLKALTLAETVPDALVLGSDTTVALDEKVLSKPADMKEAVEMLMYLSDRTHTVYTAVALYWLQGSFEHIFVERSSVRFKQLDRDLIQRYFSLVNPLDKAGAYGIQGGRELIIESVNGSVENVMGLPIQRLAAVLEDHGFDFKTS